MGKSKAITTNNADSNRTADYTDGPGYTTTTNIASTTASATAITSSVTGAAAVAAGSQRQARRVAINYVIYVLCALAVGAAAYAVHRQCQLEHRIRHQQHDVNVRLARLEQQLQMQPPHQPLHVRQQAQQQQYYRQPAAITTPTTFHTDSASSLEPTTRAISGYDDDAIDAIDATHRLMAHNESAATTSHQQTAETATTPTSVADQLLRLHATGIERLRRDVSELKRVRSVRQLSMNSPSDCGCPAGK